MALRVNFIKPGTTNFPITTNIYNYVPLPIVTFADPAVGLEDRPNSCRLVRDVTKTPPTFAENPVCFTLPDQAKTAEVFIAAMRGTISWNQISCNDTTKNSHLTIGNKISRTSYHDKIWRFACPCAGAPRKAPTLLSNRPSFPPRVVNTTVHKDGRIDIYSRNVRAVHTVTTTTHGTTKKTVVATEVTGEPSTPPATKSHKRDPSTKCHCTAKFFIRCRFDNRLHEVEWHWKHHNHNPFSLQDMKSMRASGPLKDWLSKKVLAGMTWPTLCKLLRNSDLTRVRILTKPSRHKTLIPISRISTIAWHKYQRPSRPITNSLKT